MLSEIRLRDAWLLVALSLLPACLLGVLGFRALAGEDASVRREAELGVEAIATRIVARIEHDLDESAQRIPAASSADDAGAARSIAVPSFATAVVFDAAGNVRVPALEPPHQEIAPARCEDERLSLIATRSADARAFLLASCEHAQAPSGRFVWPTIALERAPVDEPRVAAWIRAHRARLSPEERAGIRSDAVKLDQHTLVGLLDETRENASFSDALGGAAVRRALRDGVVRTDFVLGRVRRLADGRFVGFAADATSIATWLPSVTPEGFVTRLALAGETLQTSLHGVAPLGPAMRIVVMPSDPRALERRTTRSRRVLVTVVAGGAILATLAALALFARLRAERRSSALRTDFVSTVSHELRTPLASIRMLAELLEEKRVPEDERDEVHEALARESRRMSELVDRLLGFGRMAAGRVVARRERVRVDELVADAVADFETRDPTMPKVRLTAPETFAEVDAAQLRVALDNLLVNARKYARPPFEVQLSRDGAFVSIAVRDAGPGIPRRDRKRVFEPFERGDERLARATEGTGIGLSLVAHIAAAHDGRVTLDSEVGRGSTFTIRIRA